MAVHIHFLFFLFLGSITVSAHPLKTSCPLSCGKVRMHYPFGIGDGCYLESSFSILCNQSSKPSKPSKPFLEKLNLEVLDIWAENSTIRVNYPTISDCSGNERSVNVSLGASKFFFSKSTNKFVVKGCENIAAMLAKDDSPITGCMSFCPPKAIINRSNCDAINCCQSAVPRDLVTFTIFMQSSNPNTCKWAFLVEEEWLRHVKISDSWSHVPVVLGWGISKPLNLSYSKTFSSLQINSSVPLVPSSIYKCSNRSWAERNSSFICSCRPGFRGNPYLSDGCKDIDECGDLSDLPCVYRGQRAWPSCHNTFGSYSCQWIGIPPENKGIALKVGLSTSLGVVVLLVGGWFSYKIVKKKRRINQKKKFFKKNGGLLLQQQLFSNEANVESTKLFNSKDLEKATDHFNVNRILGQGGQGTVYKGMLTDGRIVAIKKSKVIGEGKLQEFINEVVILSQINHRNVVKLIGCCLETEIPLLVYEYVPNGTLAHHLSNQSEHFLLTWDIRLQIAIEVAGALYYLHSIASTPIYHRDIKSSNILLDDKYRAKIADFGISRSISIGQTHLTTLVQGTFGYLDPEYFRSSQFTEKSDVYSFGVVLTELLTGEKAISSTRTETERDLVAYFIRSIEENKLFDILDDQVLKEDKKEETIAIANLAERCLNLSGKKRPSMKEVVMELEGIRTSREGLKTHQSREELQYTEIEMNKPWDFATTSAFSVEGSKNFFTGETSGN